MKRVLALFSFLCLGASLGFAQRSSAIIDITAYGGLGFILNRNFANAEADTAHGAYGAFSYKTLSRQVMTPIDNNFIPFSSTLFGLTVAYPFKKHFSLGIGYGAQYFALKDSSLIINNLTEYYYATNATPEANGGYTLNPSNVLSARDWHALSFDGTKIWTHSAMARAKFTTDKLVGPLAVYGEIGIGMIIPQTQISKITRTYADLAIVTNGPDDTTIDNSRFTNYHSDVEMRVRYNLGLAFEGSVGIAIPIDDRWTVALGVRGFLASVSAKSFNVTTKTAVNDHTGAAHTNITNTSGTYGQNDYLYQERKLYSENGVDYYGYYDGRTGIMRNVVTRTRREYTEDGNLVVEETGLTANPFTQTFASMDIILSVSAKF